MPHSLLHAVDTLESANKVIQCKRKRDYKTGGVGVMQRRVIKRALSAVSRQEFQTVLTL